jgi:hypothetical protein
MASSHDRAAKLVAKKLGGSYNPRTSPDVKGRGGRAEVKLSVDEIPEALDNALECCPTVLTQRHPLT